MEIPAYATYRAGLISPGMAGNALTATASSLVPSVPVVPVQNNPHLAPVPAFGQNISSGTSTLQVGYMVPCGFGYLRCSFLASAGNTGPNQTAREGSTATLNGNGSSNPSGVGTLPYRWTFSSRPPGTTAVLGDISGVTPLFVVDVPGSYGCGTDPQSLQLTCQWSMTTPFRGGPGSAAITATSPIFTPGLTTVNVTAVLAVLLEVHQ